MKTVSVAILTVLVICCFARNASAQHPATDSLGKPWASWKPYQTDTTSKHTKRAKARKIVAKSHRKSADSTRLSGFMSVDRYFERYRQWSPYVYAAANPLRYTDPSGDTIVFAGADPKKTETQFNTAINYLRAGGVDMSQVDALRRTSVVITVLGTTGFDQNEYKAGSRVVEWNPGAALSTPDGRGLSPALILLHELGGHAYQEVFHKVRYSRDTDPYGAGFDQQYQTKEERRVIEQIEQPAAVLMGEGLRVDHTSGHMYGVPMPTTYVPMVPDPTPPENRRGGSPR